MKRQEELLEFISSNGTLLINEQGNVNEKESDLNEWLLTISKVDMEELGNYYRLMRHDFLPEGGDVLDFCYWDKEGKYHVADKNWRYETFHNVELKSREIEPIVDLSYEWIENNRTL